MRCNSPLVAAALLSACSGGNASHAATAVPPPGDRGYDTVGYATWYGEELAGRRTASGARFDPAAITAAHRTLPLNSYVEVTALDTGRTIVVLVNDRGPSRRDREIDLSRGAARLLGIDRNPVAAVRIRAVAASERASSPRVVDAVALAALRRRLPAAATLAPVARPAVAASGPYVVQIAAFTSRERARALADALDGEVSGAAGVWRVRLGPFDRLTAAQRARDAAARRGYGDARIVASD